MWLIHTFQGIESGILLAMALDRYVAICYPLRHGTIFTNQLITQMGAFLVARAAVLLSPGIVLIKFQHEFQLYHTTIISFLL
jgi:olfactory receptor